MDSILISLSHLAAPTLTSFNSACRGLCQATRSGRYQIVCFALPSSSFRCIILDFALSSGGSCPHIFQLGNYVAIGVKPLIVVVVKWCTSYLLVLRSGIFDFLLTRPLLPSHLPTRICRSRSPSGRSTVIKWYALCFPVPSSCYNKGTLMDGIPNLPLTPSRSCPYIFQLGLSRSVSSHP